ncbi:hypothetical protein PROAA_1190011 [Candidatus Propionivibrio aalborgensis]|uniref:Uncharacterized protein n=1 Tax=Candidatus Propionivibrio aalborgensis TaxID=1860101 RepID=A0A1A8XI08_9RHOO|nr:hypothetical protein PROAA_1190011 [Candidatus Propionivibrio aalborgensis]
MSSRGEILLIRKVQSSLSIIPDYLQVKAYARSTFYCGSPIGGWEDDTGKSADRERSGNSCVHIYNHANTTTRRGKWS